MESNLYPIAAGAALAAIFILIYRSQQDPTQETTMIEDLQIAVDPGTYTEGGTDAAEMQANITAFLDMIAGPGYADVHAHRSAALEYGDLVATSVWSLAD